MDIQASEGRVRQLNDADRVAWDAFIGEQDSGTFFHLSGWKDVLERAFGHQCHFLLYESHQRIKGVLPLAQVKSHIFGNFLVSLPFCVYGGVVTSDPVADQALHKAACDLAETMSCDYLELRNIQSKRPEWPSKDLYVTFRKDLADNDEENLKRIPKKQRAVVRKGIKSQLDFQLTNDLSAVYDVYSSSVRNLGTPVFSRKYFKVLQEVFPENSDALLITKDGETVAGVLSFYYKNEVLPYYGGGTAAARGLKANDYLYWELMRHAVRRGCTRFDFGRSKRDTGAFRFKTHWGFEPEPLSYEYHLVKANSMPNLSPTNPKYALMIKLWSRLPVRVTQLIGPPVAKYLG